MAWMPAFAGMSSFVTQANAGVQVQAWLDVAVRRHDGAGDLPAHSSAGGYFAR